MKNIDFLPQVYRERNDLRKARTWWVAVLVVFGTVVVTTASVQYTWRRTVVRKLDLLAPRYAAAQQRDAELGRLQLQIQAVSDAAGLYTYLQYPWPRTQLLAAVVAPLPKSIRLDDLLLAEEALPTQSAAEQPTSARRNKVKAETIEKKEPPALQDLARLRQDCDSRQTVIHIVGVTHDVKELHLYVGDLGKSALFTSAQLKSLESMSQDGGPLQTKFRLQLIVRPGYGQPNGPEPNPGAVAMQGSASSEPSTNLAGRTLP